MSTTFVVGKIDNRKCKIGTGALVGKKDVFWTMEGSFLVMGGLKRMVPSTLEH